MAQSRSSRQLILADGSQKRTRRILSRDLTWRMIDGTKWKRHVYMFERHSVFGIVSSDVNKICIFSLICELNYQHNICLFVFDSCHAVSVTCHGRSLKHAKILADAIHEYSVCK